MAFEKVQAKCPADADLLHLCAFLAPDAIYVRDLAGASKHLPERLSKALADELGIDEMKAALLAFSLIRTERDTIAIHRLVSDVMRKRMDPKVRDEWLGTALQVVNELLPVDVDDVGAWPACSRWLGHALTVVNWDEAEVVEPIACARILNQAGSYLCANANYNQAEPLFRRALAISERSLGSTHPHVAACLGNLGHGCIERPQGFLFSLRQVGDAFLCFHLLAERLQRRQAGRAQARIRRTRGQSERGHASPFTSETPPTNASSARPPPTK